MAKFNSKVVPVDIKRICGKTDLNIRFANNLDILGMAEEIKAAGGHVLEAVHLLKPSREDREAHNVEGDYVVLRGYRRTGGCRYIVERPNEYTAEVVKNASTVPAIVHDDMTWEEAREFVLDDNAKRPLSPSEVISAICFLFAMGRTEKEVASESYNLIYRYAIRDEAPLREIEREQNAEKRTTLIRDKLHTWLGNYIQKSIKLGAWVRDQLILWHKSKDGLLTNGEIVHFKVTTKAIQDLSKAKTADEKGGTWLGPVTNVEITNDGITITGGGEQVNAKLIELITEAKGGKPADAKSEKKPMTGKQLEDAKGSFRSEEAQAFLGMASGDKSELFIKMDNEAFRRGWVIKALKANAGNWKMPEVEALVNAIIGEANPERFQAVMKPLLK